MRLNNNMFDHPLLEEPIHLSTDHSVWLLNDHMVFNITVRSIYFIVMDQVTGKYNISPIERMVCDLHVTTYSCNDQNTLASILETYSDDCQVLTKDEFKDLVEYEINKGLISLN